MQARQGLYAPMSRRVMVVGTKAMVQAWVKPPLVQILGGVEIYSNQILNMFW